MRLSARLRALRRREDGFTLPELIITVTIIGIIAAGLTGVVISFLKTTTATQSRLTESHDVQFAAAYWQRDVSSIGVRSYDAGTKSFPLQQSVNVTPACTLPSGTPVVTLAWSEYTSSDSTAAPTTITVSYVAEPDAGGFNLLRIRCTGSTVETRPFEVDAQPQRASDRDLRHHLHRAPNVPSVVSLNVSVLDPEGRGTTALDGDPLG